MSDFPPIDTTVTIHAEVLLADPDTCKFTVSRTVHPGGPSFFASQERATGSPLVERLFALPGVAHVLVADTVVTVGKDSNAEWSALKAAIGTIIRTALLAGGPTIVEAARNPPTAGRTDFAGRVLAQTPPKSDPDLHTPIQLKRDCEATRIPSGERLKLVEHTYVVVTQSLGGSLTVRTEDGRLVRIAVLDADALGFQVRSEKEASAEAGPFSLENVIEKLKTVFDPEIPVNVVDLGLIYLCEAHPLPDGGHRVEIKMSMTAPGCGMGDVLKADARAKVEAVPGVTKVDVAIVWEPPWNQNRMSEAARLQLGML